ncbi:hypothetical protein P5G51_014240 [Virgibacillus sp. 179-BFC.A HS]|uniref:DUF3829 domain-containing protein n=1 Tax=Tigheibacillus jepli TaxID=3035914 RepID=A0ABU5CJB1_9BACI|nr:hypothetical protein [Virgibacillus sp. 179-BFC.A HS]MDY0406395.1 hypothetical protein [Virgibacillus sp. 179-BFC.A HS]
MKKMLALLMVACFVWLVGCSEKDEVPKDDQKEKELSFTEKQKAVSTFINEDVYSIAEVQLKAFDSLQDVMDNGSYEYEEKKEKNIYNTIVNETIPAFEKAAELTKEIDVKIDELEIPRKFLLDSIDAYREGLELRAQSIEEDREDLRQTSEARFVEYAQLFKQYSESIKKVAEKYKVSYKPIDVMEDENLDKFKVKQNRIISFVNEDTERVAAYEKQANDFVESVSGDNFTDEQTEYEILVNKVIPAYKKALEEAKNINPIIDELKEPQEMLQQATETVLKSFQLKAESIEKHDQDLMKTSEDKHEQYLQELDAYHQKMKKIAEKFDVTYNPDSEGLKSSKKLP